MKYVCVAVEIVVPKLPFSCVKAGRERKRVFKQREKIHLYTFLFFYFIVYRISMLVRKFTNALLSCALYINVTLSLIDTISFAPTVEAPVRKRANKYIHIYCVGICCVCVSS